MISGFLADSFAYQSVDGFSMRDPELARLWGMAPKALSGAEVTPRSVLGFSPVFRAVNLIGNAVAKCRPMIYQRLDADGQPDPEGRRKRRALEHPSWRRTVRKANDWMSAPELWKLLVVNGIMRGNGIAYTVRDGGGRILEYLPLLPNRTGMMVFDKKVREDTPIERNSKILYWTMVGSETVPLLPENIVHIRGLSGNGVWGLDVIELLKETLGLGIAARDCSALFYGQGLLASGVLYMPPGIAAGLPAGPKREEAVANFVKRIKEQATGLSKAHRLLVVDDGAKFEPMTIDPQKAQALEGREFSVREVSNIVGCQAHKLGDTKRTSYSSLEQSNQEFLDDDVDPWLARVEEQVEDVALTEEEKETGSHYVECNRKALLRTNLQARTAYHVAARQWGVESANDWLMAEGEDPIGPQGDTYIVPMNFVPADQLGATQTAATTAGVPVGGPVDEDELEDDSNGDEDAAAARLAADYRTLAMHEVGRLVTRSCEEAVRKAAKGGQEFVHFLDVLSEWCHEPAPLRPLLEAVGVRLSTEFDQYTKPPHAAADLKTNVAAHVERIQQETLAFAVQQLEPTR
jgi:HK97 family phage portal protein